MTTIKDVKRKGGRQRSSLVIGGKAEWSTWEEFERDLKEWQVATSTCLVRRDRKRSIVYNSACGYSPSHACYIDPGRWTFAHQTWKCVHYGMRKISKDQEAEASRTKKRRRVRVPHRGCNFRIYVKLNPILERLQCTVTAHFPEEPFNNEHNHEVGRELFRMYKQNRRLEEKEKERQREIMMMSAPPRAALRELKKESGKPFTLRSIYNFRYLERKRHSLVKAK